MRRLGLYRAALAGILAAFLPMAAAAVVTPAPTASGSAAALTHLKTKGATEIDRRVQNLQGALDKLGKNKTLKAADVTALSKQVNDEINQLKALKVKLAAETTVTGARIDVQSIVTDYRVYVLMLPKSRLVASADRFATAEQKLTALETNLQSRVTAAGKKGQNIAAMQAKLDDMSAKLTEAKTKSAGVVAEVLALQPTGYNANHTVLGSYRDSLKAAQADLVRARDDAKNVRTALGK
jgi:DNA repair exonuclease SbcCD ATPase subunit